LIEKYILGGGGIERHESTHAATRVYGSPLDLKLVEVHAVDEGSGTGPCYGAEHRLVAIEDYVVKRDAFDRPSWVVTPLVALDRDAERTEHGSFNFDTAELISL
jgi:hypothetical protein